MLYYFFGLLKVTDILACVWFEWSWLWDSLVDRSSSVEGCRFQINTIRLVGRYKALDWDLSCSKHMCGWCVLNRNAFVSVSTANFSSTNAWYIWVTGLTGCLDKIIVLAILFSWNLSLGHCQVHILHPHDYILNPLWQFFLTVAAACDQ